MCGILLVILACGLFRYSNVGHEEWARFSSQICNHIHIMIYLHVIRTPDSIPQARLAFVALTVIRNANHLAIETGVCHCILLLAQVVV